MSQQIKSGFANRRINPLIAGISTLLSLWWLSSCESIPTDPSVFDTADLLGVVYDGSAKAAQGFEIVIDGKGVSVSDLNGHFTFSGVKRGKHEIEARKAGFETFKTTFDFLHKSQVLYLTVFSLQDFLQNADIALGKKDFAAVDANLARAAGIDPKNPVVIYMKAVLAATIGDYDAAMKSLDSLIALGVKDEPVYLLRLDIALVEPRFADAVRADIESQSLLRLNPRIAKKLANLAPKKD